ncbi:hypothetical protein BX666DRAFT_2012121 [Dichotomocladium elegans]|nr:hypothetical protein BX666DRAFT_2012121 [Dichotomocladium elegans]
MKDIGVTLLLYPDTFGVMKLGRLSQEQFAQFTEVVNETEHILALKDIPIAQIGPHLTPLLNAIKDLIQHLP